MATGQIKILCWLGFHDWDGHTSKEYPPPRCKRCGKWHTHLLCSQVMEILGAEVMEKLKPCPFAPCKGEGQVVSEFVAKEFYVYCLNCGRHTDIYDTEEKAIKAWSRRTG